MLRIMLVDDSPADARLIEVLLATVARPYELDWRKDGAEAVEELNRKKSLPGGRLPNLILMDLNMPRMNGLETLRHLKGDPELSVIPVIILSSTASPAEIREIYRAHANCFVQKQPDLESSERLLQTIEALWVDFALLPSSGATQTYVGPEVAPFAPSLMSQRVIPDARLSGKLATRGCLRCDDHRRLMEEFAVSVRELLDLHQQQFEAAVRGEADCNRFDLLIHMASENKQQAKYAYLRHVEEHGCSNLDVISSASGA